MSQDTLGVSADFPSRAAAHTAKDRLIRAGFARNSIDIYRRGDEYVVHLPTREENRPRAARILKGQALTEGVKRQGARAADALGSHPLITLGFAALAGFALYGLTSRG